MNKGTVWIAQRRLKTPCGHPAGVRTYVLGTLTLNAKGQPLIRDVLSWSAVAEPKDIAREWQKAGYQVAIL
jgi:hypothetical protein